MKIFKKLLIRDKKNGIEKLTLDHDNIPIHIAIIMDGNGRWAKKRGLPRTAGHKAGVEALREIIKTCSDLKVKHLTLYAFSTENWNRPEDEVTALMKLLISYLKNEIKELDKNDVRISTIGNISKLPLATRDEIYSALDLTKNNVGLNVNIALNYGGRDEIVNAVKNICKDVFNNELNIEDIDECIFKNYLYTKNIPDPDLVIRPSGELRISNFLLWQAAYSELWFSDIYWPDFGREDLVKAIVDFQKRNRRYGGIK